MPLDAEHTTRINRLREEMSRAGVDLVAVAPGSNMRYLLGFTPVADERPCVLLISRDDLRFVVPSLTAEQVAAHTGLDLLVWTDAQGPERALRQAAGELPRARVLAFDNTMRADTLIPVYDAFTPERMTLSSGVLGKLRMRKTPAELAALQRAAEQADRVLAAAIAACEPGKTEAEVAQVIVDAFHRDGAEAVDFVIVASGPNAAFPHHHTGQRTLQPGDAVVIDIGATLDGYKSDITRMVHLGPPSEAFRRVYDAVLEANQRAKEAVRPGVPARVVDRAARDYLETVGYADYFVHRTGHGLGLDVHEPPYITSESDTVLEPGMVFSIEPGVYLPDRFGVRIEDIVAVTEDGVRVLTGASHELAVR